MFKLGIKDIRQLFSHDLEFLRKSCIKSEKEQINNKIQIVNVFKRFWGRNPSENEVIVAMTGLVLRTYIEPFPDVLVDVRSIELAKVVEAVPELSIAL